MSNLTERYQAGSAVKTYDDDEIVGDFRQPCCRKRRFQTLILSLFLVSFVSLCITIPIVLLNARKNSEEILYGSIWLPLGAKLFASVGDQEFGESIDLTSNGAILAIGSNAINYNTGQVEIRKYDGLTWRQLGDVIPGKRQNENFGHTVQLSKEGEVLVAGGFGTDDDNNMLILHGVIRGYQWNDDEQRWEQLGSDIQGSQLRDRFGVSLSMSKDGKSWIAGADNYKGENGERNGYAKVYFLNDKDEWYQKGSTIMGKNGERTGYAVAMSGDGNTVCVGDRWYEDENGIRRGRARCYGFADDWILKTNIIGTTENGEFGYSLSLNYDGSRIAVGNRYGGDDKQGSVAVFQLEKRSYRRLGSELVSIQKYDQGGFEVDLNDRGNVLAWTARGHNIGGVSNGTDFDTGIVRIAQFVNGDWQQLGNDLIGDDAKTFFGESVSLNDDGTIIAASANLGDIEYVRIFEFN